jgi:hypothetical protein
MRRDDFIRWQDIVYFDRNTKEDLAFT